MASETKKSAHAMCSCTVNDDQKYCSQVCEDSKDMTELACDCPHPGCSGHAV